MTTDETVPDGPSDHDERGRFRRGNKAGRGNRIALRQAELRKILDDALADDDVRSVVAGLVAAAKAGDVAASALLLNHAIGRPRTSPQFLDLPTGELVDSFDVAATLRGIVRDVGRGALDVETAQAAAGLVEQVATANQWQELAERVARLESSK